MLLRGVKFPPPTLDRADIEGTKAKARSSGRSYGGAPLRHNGYGNGNGNNNGYNRGGNINYADSRDSRPNPFAAYVNVNQQPPTGNHHQQGRPPPPPGAGWRPPHGQNYNQGPPQHDNGYQQRYSGPPPPAHGYNGYAPPGWNSGYVQPPPPPHYNGYDGRK
jgi:5'-3' exoribonuclease 2